MENPQITQRFLKQIKTQSEEIINVDGIVIKTCKNVFPPQSEFSYTSKGLFKIFGDLNGKKVLDMGTGTGVQAIHAAKSGASEVLAVDKSTWAVSCAIKNVKLNKVDSIVHIIQSDLFNDMDIGNTFDLIIANLRITNCNVTGIVESSLYDPDYAIHKRFFDQAKKYLSKSGRIVITHINFGGSNDFADFEKMSNDYGYEVESFVEIDAIGHKWRMYRLKVG